MGIYWVYFKTSRGDEMKLDIDAQTRELAMKCGMEKAREMGFGWKFDKIQACR